MENLSSSQFFQLINRSRTKTESKTACIQVGCVWFFFDPEAQRQCFIEFFEDLKLPKDQNFNKIFLELCHVRCMETKAKCQVEFETGVCISEADVDMAIDELNSGKSMALHLNILRQLNQQLFQLSQDCLIELSLRKRYKNHLRSESLPQY